MPRIPSAGKNEPERVKQRIRRIHPFAFQLLGYLTWNNGGKFRAVLPEYKQYLNEYVYNKIWTELSEKDRKILYGISEANDDSVQAIKEQLQISGNEWSPYRQRLIRKGIVDGSHRGTLKLTLPLFGEFVKEKKCLKHNGNG